MRDELKDWGRFASLLQGLLQRQSPGELLAAAAVVPAALSISLTLLCWLRPFLMGAGVVYGAGLAVFAVYKIVWGLCHA